MNETMTQNPIIPPQAPRNRLAIYLHSGLFDGWRLITIIVSLLVAIPLGVILFSFVNPEKEIWQHLVDTLLWQLLKNTFWLVTGVATCTTILGVALAWFCATCNFPGRNFFSWALLLPMAMPTYVLAFVFLGIFDFTGPVQTHLRELFGSGFRMVDIRSTGGVIAVMSLALYPYVFLLTKNGFRTQGVRGLEAAEILGCGPISGFFRVALPMTRPWIAGGLLLVIMETLADFGAVSIFNYDTFTTAIYKAWFGFFSLKAAAQLSSILILIVFCIMELESLTRRRRRFSQSERAQSQHCPLTLSPLKKWLVTFFCSLTLLFSFGFPLLQIIIWSLKTFQQEFSRQYLSYLAHSLILGLLSAALITTLALILAYASRRHSDTMTQLLIRIATLGYGLPGTVLAVGIFIPVTFLDNTFIDLGHKIFGMEIKPILQGTLLVMILAYTTRFMAAAFKAIDSAMHRLTPSIDEAARLMGLRGFELLGRVHLPILKGGILTGITVVFVDVMKEMPITLMTRPFGWDTLAVKIFELTSEGEWERAALPALSLILAGVLPIIFFMRQSNH